MIVWLGDWGAPEKFIPISSLAGLALAGHFQRETNWFARRLKLMSWIKMCFKNVAPSFYFQICCDICCDIWVTVHALFLPGHTENSTPPSLMNGQRVLLSWEQQESTEDLLQTSNIQPCLWVYDIHISDFSHRGITFMLQLQTSICRLFGSLALQTPATAQESLNVRGWSASSFPCFIASLLTCTTALRPHWWLVLTEKWRGSFHHLLYASVKNKQSSHLQRKQTQAMTFADIQFKTLKSPRAPCLPSSLSFGRRPQLSKLAKGMRRRTSLMEVWQSFYGRFQ